MRAQHRCHCVAATPVRAASDSGLRSVSLRRHSAGLGAGSTIRWLHFGLVAVLGLVAWATVAVMLIDNFLKPLVMRHGTGLPTMMIFFGVAGGLAAYGPLGLFAGPAVIAVFVAMLRVFRRTYGDEDSVKVRLTPP